MQKWMELEFTTCFYMFLHAIQGVMIPGSVLHPKPGFLITKKASSFSRILVSVRVAKGNAQLLTGRYHAGLRLGELSMISITVQSVRSVLFSPGERCHPSPYTPQDMWCAAFEIRYFLLNTVTVRHV